MKKHELSAEAEVAFLREIQADPSTAAIVDIVRNAFHTLQLKSQLLLSLIAICLTITGFSGPRIAAAGGFARWGLALGLVGALASAVVLLQGPLRLRWVSSHRPGDFDQCLAALLRERNSRSRDYRRALLLLAVGLSFYVGAVVVYLVRGEVP